MALCVGNRWFIAFIGDKTHGASESRLLSQPDPKPRHGNGFLLGSTQEGRRWPSEAAVPKGSPLGAVAVPCLFGTGDPVCCTALRLAPVIASVDRDAAAKGAMPQRRPFPSMGGGTVDGRAW